MATGTAIALGISAASAAASTGMAIHQAQKGRERQREAEQALDSYERQDLKNVYANLRVPMEGYRMREQEIQQQTANQAEMMSMAGARGMAGTTALMMQSQMGMAAIQADLEQSQFRVKQMIASEEARIQGMQERREEQDLAGLGAERAAGAQQYQTGVAGAIKGVGALGTTVMGAFAPTETTDPTIQTTKIPEINTDPYGDPLGGGVNPATGYGRYGQ